MANKEKIKITRRSLVGCGWKVWTPDNPKPPVKPGYTGTPRQVLDFINADRTLQSIVNGHTWHSTQWFVKTNRHWAPVSFVGSIHDLFINNHDGKGYIWDSIDAIVEQ